MTKKEQKHMEMKDSQKEKVFANEGSEQNLIENGFRWKYRFTSFYNFEHHPSLEEYLYTKEKIYNLTNRQIAEDLSLKYGLKLCSHNPIDLWTGKEEIYCISQHLGI